MLVYVIEQNTHGILIALSAPGEYTAPVAFRKYRTKTRKIYGVEDIVCDAVLLANDGELNTSVARDLITLANEGYIIFNSVPHRSKYVFAVHYSNVNALG